MLYTISISKGKKYGEKDANEKVQANIIVRLTKNATSESFDAGSILACTNGVAATSPLSITVRLHDLLANCEDVKVDGVFNAEKAFKYAEALPAFKSGAEWPQLSDCEVSVRECGLVINEKPLVGYDFAGSLNPVYVRHFVKRNDQTKEDIIKLFTAQIARNLDNSTWTPKYEEA